jgi:glycosyltransferase involved in cell wall biosynthesis
VTHSLPTVSVVIPCFNQARYLSAAIQSVLNQRYRPVECIVVDDGSTDETSEVASILGVSVIQQTNRGVSESRNAGLAAASGDLVVFLDADDELLPEGIELGVEALESNEQAAAVVGRCEAIDTEGRALSVPQHEIDSSNLYREWLTKNFVWTPGAAMFRRHALAGIGGFPASLGPAADYAVYLRLARTGRVAMVPRHVVRYRQHDASMSRDPALMLRATMEVLKRESREAPSWAQTEIRRGRKSWSAWYGEQIVRRLRRDWRERRWGADQVRAALTVLRNCPSLALRHGARKTRRVLTGAVPLADTSGPRSTPDRAVEVDPASSAASTVGIVITTYNHASFLEDALSSVVAQTRPADAILVVDDGSTDNPAAIVARFPGAKLLRQENSGLAAARNAGLAETGTTYVVFLDADDRLEPRAIEAGLACFSRTPDCGFVYGGHRYIDRGGQPIGERYEPPGSEPFLRLLGGNFIAMHGAVMYRRDRLRDCGGFDPTLRQCEDYDVYLRMVQRYPIAGYADLVAAYRLHGANMSSDHRSMLRSALAVHARYRPARGHDARLRSAWKAGRRAWRRYYATEMARGRYRYRRGGGTLTGSLPMLAKLASVSPTLAAREALRGLRHRLAAVMPRRVRNRVPGLVDRPPDVGGVRFGDLGRVTPVSADFGFDRGLPIDRYYIERFLTRHASEIVGRVLEIGDDAYTRRFGGFRVSQSEVLHVRPGNPRATFVGDLNDPRVLPENAFNCIVITQTLHLIYDVRTAVAMLHRALAPGGVVLATAPGISQIDRGEWGGSWFWSFTPSSIERLFAEMFGRDQVLVEHHGNVFGATAFLQGLAVEDVDTAKLDPLDKSYPVIVGVRARKRIG